MRSEAWLADGLFDCHHGELVLGDRTVSFLNEEGASIFDFDLNQVAFSFPRYLFTTGLDIHCAGEKRRVLFANPYLDGAGVRAARGTGRLWRDALDTRNLPFVHASEQASHNGDLARAVEASVVARGDTTQLGDVLAGNAEGRRSDDEITVFDSTGLAIQDLAIALATMERAGELNLPTIDL